ncbi:hypothetical protein F5Y03DRAFT_284954 [Xylaria venustula]|nr:hypothetical protein F5Y03DRAFT_284954 [Xylaria venustula]
MAGGENGPIGHVSLSLAVVLSGLFAISEYNVLEIFVFIFRTFRRRRGLYFCSAICANLGIMLTSLFCFLRSFNIAPSGLMAMAIDIGWWMMVSGQSLMLYSRLHLVICDPRKLRWLLVMIFAVFVFIQIPVGALFILDNYKKSTVSVAFDAMEKTQLVVITVQESILSGMYLYEWARTRKELEITKGQRVRALYHELIILFVVVVALDVSLMVLQFLDLFEVQTAYKPLVYSVKLKVETYVLNNLVNLVLSKDSFPNDAFYRHDPTLFNTRSNDSSRRPRHVHSLSAPVGTTRHGSETECGSSSTLSTGQSCGLKVPKDVLSV